MFHVSCPHMYHANKFFWLPQRSFLIPMWWKEGSYISILALKQTLGMAEHKMLILNIRNLKHRGFILAHGHTKAGNLDNAQISCPSTPRIRHNVSHSFKSSLSDTKSWKSVPLGMNDPYITQTSEWSTCNTDFCTVTDGLSCCKHCWNPTPWELVGGRHTVPRPRVWQNPPASSFVARWLRVLV